MMVIQDGSCVLPGCMVTWLFQPRAFGRPRHVMGGPAAGFRGESLRRPSGFTGVQVSGLWLIPEMENGPVLNIKGGSLVCWFTSLGST